MRFCRKNIVYSIVFLLGIIWCYTVYFQQNEIKSQIELNSENNPESSYIDTDFENQEVEHFICAPFFLTAFRRQTEHNHFQLSAGLTQPLYPIWQPPKLS